MKIILYANRNTGLCALSYLVALGHEVSVITEDNEVRWMASTLGCISTTFSLIDFYDALFCVHGRKIIPNEYLREGKMINIHPTRYNGHNPVKEFIKSEDMFGTLRAMYMTEVVDGGETIAEEIFETGVCSSYADFYNIALPYYFKIIDRVLKIVS